MSNNSLSLEGEVYPPSAAPVRRTPDSFGEATRGRGEGATGRIHTPSPRVPVTGIFDKSGAGSYLSLSRGRGLWLIGQSRVGLFPAAGRYLKSDAIGFQEETSPSVGLKKGSVAAEDLR
jgi:hypothetical protein